MFSRRIIASTARMFSDVSTRETTLERLAQVRKEIIGLTEQLDKLKLEESKLTTRYKSPTEEANNTIEKDHSQYHSTSYSRGG